MFKFLFILFICLVLVGLCCCWHFGSKLCKYTTDALAPKASLWPPTACERFYFRFCWKIFLTDGNKSSEEYADKLVKAPSDNLSYLWLVQSELSRTLSIFSSVLCSLFGMTYEACILFKPHYKSWHRLFILV